LLCVSNLPETVSGLDKHTALTDDGTDRDAPKSLVLLLLLLPPLPLLLSYTAIKAKSSIQL
jgi:hypothetical protein